LATAVPEVVIQAAGVCVARPTPRAAKALPRSSTCSTVSVSGWRAAATVSGVEREPGAMKNVSTPFRTSSSTSSCVQRYVVFGEVRRIRRVEDR